MKSTIPFAWLLWAILSIPASGQVEIPHEHRVHNATGSQCGYASLETLANYHGITELQGITRQYRGLSDPQGIARLLREKNVANYCCFPGGRYSTEWAKYACDNGYGCLIGLNGSHAVVLTSLDSEAAKIISNNRPSLETQTMPRDVFDRQFDGWVVIIWRRQ